MSCGSRIFGPSERINFLSKGAMFHLSFVGIQDYSMCVDFA